VFVVIFSHFAFHGLARPSFLVVLFHIIAMLFAVATFVYCFLQFPYQECRNSSSQGCNVDKVAVPMDGVLMYINPSSE
jgi:putative exporter of polyketide antibiotics